MSKPEDQNKERQRMHEETIVSVDYVYANSTVTQGSNWDVRIAFSENVGSKRIPKAGIVMGHQQAKAFHAALGNTLEKLEKMIGAPIRYKLAHPELASQEVDEVGI